MRPVGHELPSDLRDLLDRAASGVEPPVRSKQRVSERLALSIAALPAIGGGGNPASGPAPTGSGPAVSRSGLSQMIAGAGRAAWQPVAAAFVVGTLAGAGGYAILERPPAERIVYRDRTVEVETSSPALEMPTVVAPTPTPLSSAPAETSERRYPRRISAHATLARAADLEAERSLLDVARRALVEGRREDAFEALGEHGRRFPRGVLVEEREALAINALVASQHYDEARERAGDFVRRFPNSLLRPSVEAALAAIP